MLFLFNNYLEHFREKYIFIGIKNISYKLFLWKDFKVNNKSHVHNKVIKLHIIKCNIFYKSYNNMMKNFMNTDSSTPSRLGLSFLGCLESMMQNRQIDWPLRLMIKHCLTMNFMIRKAKYKMWYACFSTLLGKILIKIII